MKHVRAVMDLALMFAQGEPRRVPAVRREAGAVVDRQPRVIAELGTRAPVGLVLVHPRTPVAGQVDLREPRLRRQRQSNQQNTGNGNAADELHLTLLLGFAGQPRIARARQS